MTKEIIRRRKSKKDTRMAKRKRAKGLTIIPEAPHKRLTIEQYEPH